MDALSLSFSRSILLALSAMSGETGEVGVKRLAELKGYLERRIRESQEEVEELRSYLEVVDSILAERSFRRAEVPPGLITSAESVPARKAEPSPPLELTPILTTNGVHIADIKVTGKTLQLVPDPKLKFEVNAPPMRAFLIGRVLEPMQAKDREFQRQGQLPPDQVMSYKLSEAENALKELVVENFGDDKRLLELKNSIRWTLRRMYERIQTRPQ